MLSFLDSYAPLISFCALLAAVFSICLTLHLNARDFLVDRIHWDFEDPDAPGLSFRLVNMGAQTLTILSIEFYSGKDHIEPIVNYVPTYEDEYETYPYDEPDMFDGVEAFIPYGTETYFYRFEKAHPELKVKVRSKERIKLFRHSRSFSCGFNKKR